MAALPLPPGELRHGLAQDSAVALSSRIPLANGPDPIEQSRPRTGAAERNELRLLCDEMLKGIGRWLRAAGYDVAIAEDGACDDDLLAHARAESRLPLTCDRRLGARAGEDIAIAVLASESLDEAARELSVRLGVDRLHAPFSRCLLDNTCLAPARATTSRGPRLRRGEVPAPHP